MASSNSVPQADEATRVVSSAAPPAGPNGPAAGASTPGNAAPAAAPLPTEEPSAPKSPLAALAQHTVLGGGPQKRRLLAGTLVAGSVAALALFTNFKSADQPEEASDLPEGLGGDTTGAADTSHRPATHHASAPVRDVPVVISTDRPVAETLADDLSIDDARDIARAEVGPEGFFKWHDQIHTTTTEEEFDLKSDEDKASFVGGLTWHENQSEGASATINGLAMEVEVPFLEKVGEWSMYSHTDEITGETDYYLGDADGHGKLLEHISKDEYGNMVRTDPETGEVTPFTPTTILDQVADGVIDVQFYPSDVDLIDGTPTVEPIDAVVIQVDNPYESPYILGYDDDGTPHYGGLLLDEGDIDLSYLDDDKTAPVVEPAPVAELKSDSELLSDRMHDIAEQAGIEDVSKIKMHESGDGWDYKIKGDDGEKVKGHISMADLHGHAGSPDQEDAHSTDHSASNPEPTHAPSEQHVANNLVAAPEHHGPSVFESLLVRGADLALNVAEQELLHAKHDSSPAPEPSPMPLPLPDPVDTSDTQAIPTPFEPTFPSTAQVPQEQGTTGWQYQPVVPSDEPGTSQVETPTGALGEYTSHTTAEPTPGAGWGYPEVADAPVHSDTTDQAPLLGQTDPHLGNEPTDTSGYDYSSTQHEYGAHDTEPTV